MLPAVQDVLYIKAVVYNSLGDMRGRDEAAKEHMSVGREQRDLESIDVNDDWADIWYLISEACVILSSRHWYAVQYTVFCAVSWLHDVIGR